MLFAPFSSTVTHDMKVAGWEKVLTTAKSIGVVAQERDWKFLRDKVFSVWKSRTLLRPFSTCHSRSLWILVAKYLILQTGHVICNPEFQLLLRPFGLRFLSFHRA